MTHPYTNPDRKLLLESHGMLCVCQPWGDVFHVINVKTIQSVVTMIPFPLRKEEEDIPAIRSSYQNAFYVGEKPFLSSRLKGRMMKTLMKKIETKSTSQVDIFTYTHLSIPHPACKPQPCNMFPELKWILFELSMQANIICKYKDILGTDKIQKIDELLNALMMYCHDPSQNTPSQDTSQSE